MKVDIFEHLGLITDGSDVVLGYRVIKDYHYFSKRYQKHIVARVSDKPYDGATGAIDINSYGWLIHDVVKRDKCFSDGSECSNLQASCILYDILKSEGRWFRARSWYLTTLIWGSIVK